MSKSNLTFIKQSISSTILVLFFSFFFFLLNFYLRLLDNHAGWPYSSRKEALVIPCLLHIEWTKKNRKKKKMVFDENIKDMKWEGFQVCSLHSKPRLGVWHSIPTSIDRGLFPKQWQWRNTGLCSNSTEEWWKVALKSSFSSLEPINFQPKFD